MHLVGFIIRKFATMHGHVNVKKKEHQIKYATNNMLLALKKHTAVARFYIFIHNTFLLSLQHRTSISVEY